MTKWLFYEKTYLDVDLYIKEQYNTIHIERLWIRGVKYKKLLENKGHRLKAFLTRVFEGSLGVAKLKSIIYKIKL